jgi:hypothetical protein
MPEVIDFCVCIYSRHSRRRVWGSDFVRGYYWPSMGFVNLVASNEIQPVAPDTANCQESSSVRYYQLSVTTET